MSASQIEEGCRDSQGVLVGVCYYPNEAVGEPCLTAQGS